MGQAPFPSEGFSGVVRVDGQTWAFGFAHRAHEIPNTPETQFGIASGTKGITALVANAVLPHDLLARELLESDLPLIDDGVTVEHLLTHTSGIGDYLDEEVVDDFEGYLMPVPVHELATTEDYLGVLQGHPQLFEPGERFKYCNGGYVVLALLCERAAGVSFYDLVQQHVLDPAGMRDTAFLRSDALPAGAALGYLADGRTNVFHLPVRGSGDGGIYTTLDDVDRLWAFISNEEPVGFVWRDPLRLVGGDAGVAFKSVRGRYTIISNCSVGAGPVAAALDAEGAGTRDL
jgi:CubicO group peptidase (beta-lactamase class C family)